jgi:predicted kinase
VTSHAAGTPGRILILTGPPGAGKTTVARLLADASEIRTVHLHTDDFFAAIRTGFIAPWLAQSHSQNLTVSTAIAACAGAFAVGGYLVIVDGIVGPWFLDLYRDEARRSELALDYVVLRPDKADAVERAATRTIAPLNDYPPHIFEGFADLGGLEGHVVVVGDQGPDEVARAVREGAAAERFRLSL